MLPHQDATSHQGQGLGQDLGQDEVESDSVESDSVEYVKAEYVSEADEAIGMAASNVLANIEEFKQAAAAHPLRDAFAGFELTPDQDHMVQSLWEFFQSNDQVFLLKGYAGTGKTFLVSGVARYLEELSVNFQGCAPTGKAALVLSEKAKISSAATIHKTIYDFKSLEKKDDIDSADGASDAADDEILSAASDLVLMGVVKKGTLPACFVLFVDESSMISDDISTGEKFVCGSGKLLSDIFVYLDLAKNPGHKVIFIGDGAQLPPVMSKYSPALSERYILEHFAPSVRSAELCDIVRQKADSAIMESASFLRSGIETKSFQRLCLSVRPPEIEVANDYFIHKLARLYQDDLRRGQLPRVTMLCFSNKQALGYNLILRRDIFSMSMQSKIEQSVTQFCIKAGPNEEMTPSVQRAMDDYKNRPWLHELDLQDGELLLVVRNNYNLDFYNGQLVILESYDRDAVENHVVKFRYKDKDSGPTLTAEITLRFVNAKISKPVGEGVWETVSAKVLTNALYSTEAGISELESRALYIDFVMRHKGIPTNSDAFKSLLRTDKYFNALQVHFGYAITCHKAQGSEWDHVFVECISGVGKSEFNFRWLYTAITRAQSKLTLLHYHERTFTNKTKIVGTNQDESKKSVFETADATDVACDADMATATETEPAVSDGAEVSAKSTDSTEFTESKDSPALVTTTAPVEVMDPIKQLVLFCQQVCENLGFSDITVSHEAAYSYQEVIAFRDQQGCEMYFNLYYGSDNKYSTVSKRRSSFAHEVTQAIESVLKSTLRGKNRMQLVVIEGAGTAVTAGGISSKLPDMGNAGYNDFLQKVHQALESHFIKVLSWEKKDAYRLRLTVQVTKTLSPVIVMGDSVGLDLISNKKGELTTIDSAHSLDRSKPLFQEVANFIRSLG